MNRWGNVITVLDDPSKSWDGNTDSGNKCAEGTYFYRMEFTYSNGEEDSKHGFITLIH